MPIALSVNLNKIALLRNAREDNNPSIETFANMALDAGANGLTAHPRPDQRHIRASDIPLLSSISRQRNVEFNIEGNPFAGAQGSYPGLMSLVESAQPEQCTLVPDSDDQLTSDHGFNLKKDFDKLVPIIQRLKQLNIRVSLFMDPDLKQIDLVKKLGADRIELYTGPFATAYAQSSDAAELIFQQHVQAARHAHSLGLGVNAGHDLNLQNMQMYKHLPFLDEVSIGHALTADALHLGFKNAVSAYTTICQA